MSDTIYLYPKTSCPCESCGETKCVKPHGSKTNMSVKGCDYPECLNCTDRVFLGTSIDPVNKSGWSEINPQVYTDKFADGFGKIPCSQGKGCPDPSYISWDPRLYSTTRYNYLPLDRPPIDGNVKLKDVYDKKWDGYGTGYTPYEKIRDGQIEYYIDKSIQHPYFEPLFAEKAREVAALYRDPMGSMKPEYTREPLCNTENPAVNCRTPYPYCLGFMQDTQSHREDLLSYQMRVRNQQRWESRWVYE